MSADPSAATLPPDFADPKSSTRVLLDCMTEGVSLSREDGIIVVGDLGDDPGATILKAGRRSTIVPVSFHASSRPL